MTFNAALDFEANEEKSPTGFHAVLAIRGNEIGCII